MADATNTTTGSSKAKSSKVPDGYETITVTVPIDRDEALTQRLISQLEGPKTTVVGNLADLQRMGAAVATGGKIEDGVLNPPNTVDGEQQPLNAQPLEDVIAPGPAAFGADAAEAAFGDRVAQGDRPSK